MVTLVIQVLSPILRVSPILRAHIARYYCATNSLYLQTLKQKFLGKVLITVDFFQNQKFEALLRFPHLSI